MQVINLPNSANSLDTTEKQLIIGAGFVGLGIAQALKEANIAYDQVDGSDRIGGNWYHGVYQTAHLISSKKVTEFPHFPMPKTYPHFPNAQQMWDYLQAFAEHFQLGDRIELNQTVTYVRPTANNLWEVSFAQGETRLYKGVIICNGHHWCQRFPELKGEFKGEIIHSKAYKHPDQLRGKRVLVIGGGNSACDLAAEAARVSEKSLLSLRESVWFIPKSFAGVPVSDLVAWWMPEWLQRLLIYGIIRLTFGPHKNYGLPQPQHRIFAKHPTLNNEVPYYIQHGRILPKPAVRYLDGWEVEFVDGSRETVELIVCATGFKVAYPFLPPALQRVKGAIVQCYGGSFLADYKGLACVGWGQSRGGVGPLIAAYGPLFARCLQLQDEIKIPIGLVFQNLGQSLPKTHLSDFWAVQRQLRLFNYFFGRFAKRAYHLDAKYSVFWNQPLP